MSSVASPSSNHTKREREESSEKPQDSSKRPRNDEAPSLSSSSAPSSTISTIPSIPSSLLLSEIHPDMSLTEDALLLLEQITHTLIVAIKTSGGDNTMFTLPIVQNCLGMALKECGELLTHAQNEGTKAVAKATSTTSSATPSATPNDTRARTIKMFDDRVTRAETSLSDRAVEKQQYLSQGLSLADFQKIEGDDEVFCSQLFSMDEKKLNDLILTLLKQGNKDDAQSVIDIDFKKYDLKPNDETLQIMSRADELRDERNLAKEVREANGRTMKAAFSSVIFRIFQTTGHSLTEPALIFLSEIAEYFTAEHLELAGNVARDNKRKDILPGDIKIGMLNDLELGIMSKNLNLNQFERWASINGLECLFSTFQLVSGVDGQVKHVLLNTLVYYWKALFSWDECNPSLALLSEMNGASELKVIIPNATSSGIQALYEWHFGVAGTGERIHGEKLVIKSTNKDGDIIDNIDEKLDRWRQLNVADPTLYANVLVAADFLGCEELCNDLLHSFDDLATNPIDTIRSCYEIVPNFAEMLFFQLGLPNVVACESFLTKLTTNAEELTYIELQLCDGLYLAKGALHNLSTPLKMQPNETLLPSPIFQRSLYESIKEDGFGKAKTLDIKTHLNLQKWTRKERLRRKAMFSVEIEANKLIRFPEGNVDDRLYYSSAPSVASATSSAAYHEFHERLTSVFGSVSEAFAPTTQAPTPAPEQKQLHFKNLDQRMWVAVASDDLVAAQQLYKQGACANLWNGGIPYDLYVSNGVFNGDEQPNGLTTLMQASCNNSITMMTWLIGVGCDVNSAVPQHEHGDYGSTFGGATALVFATTPSAIKLLLSCGAKTTDGSWGKSILYRTRNYFGNVTCFTILASHLTLRRGSDRDIIARALVRHGANVNEASYPCERDGQGWRNGSSASDDPPVSYWPSVVASGDVAWAKELIEKYNANINWPMGAAFEGKVTGLGATVLQIAIMKENVKMVKMLLEKPSEDQSEHYDSLFDTNYSEPAGVNYSEVVSFDGNDVDELAQNQEDGYDQNFIGISHTQRKHYWGKDSWAKCHKVAVADIKKASPLSVALAIGNKEIITLLKQAGATSHPENATVPVTYDWNLKTN